ncbi:MAG: hypothetical protein ACOCXQ_02450 [Patescibacteria group bacterium]
MKYLSIKKKKFWISVSIFAAAIAVYGYASFSLFQSIDAGSYHVDSPYSASVLGEQTERGEQNTDSRLIAQACDPDGSQCMTNADCCSGKCSGQICKASQSNAVRAFISGNDTTGSRTYYAPTTMSLVWSSQNASTCIMTQDTSRISFEKSGTRSITLRDKGTSYSIRFLLRCDDRTGRSSTATFTANVKPKPQPTQPTAVCEGQSDQCDPGLGITCCAGLTCQQMPNSGSQWCQPPPTPTTACGTPKGMSTIASPTGLSIATGVSMGQINNAPAVRVDAGTRRISWPAYKDNKYYIRVDNLNDGKSCVTQSNKGPEDVCDAPPGTISQNYFDYTFKKGTTYRVWLHNADTCNNWGSHREIAVVVPADNPDLVVEDIVRDGVNYRAKICNRGTGKGNDPALRYTLEFASLNAQGTVAKSYTTPSANAYAIPEPGSCTMTGGINCAALGSNCTDAKKIRVTIDNTATIPETNDNNNTFTKEFTAPEPTVAQCPRKGQGDANCDNKVKLDDLEIFRQELNGEVDGNRADFNEDGKHDLVDFWIWRVGFLSDENPPVPTNTQVPTAEPEPEPEPEPTATTVPQPTTPAGGGDTGTNLLLNKPVIQTTGNVNYGTNRDDWGESNDGKIDSTWLISVRNLDAVYDLQSNEPIGKVRYQLTWDSNAFKGQGRVGFYISSDNRNWKKVQEQTISNERKMREVDFKGATGRYIRIKWEGPFNGAWGDLFEIEAYRYGGSGRVPTDTPVPTATTVPQPTSVPEEATAANLLRNKPIVKRAGNINDGSNINDWGESNDGNSNTSWLINVGTLDVVYDLQSQQHIKTLKYKLTWDTNVMKSAGAIGIYISRDNVNWTQVDKRFHLNTSDVQVINVKGRYGRYFRIKWEGMKTNANGELYEVSVYK